MLVVRLALAVLALAVLVAAPRQTDFVAQTTRTPPRTAKPAVVAAPAPPSFAPALDKTAARWVEATLR